MYIYMYIYACMYDSNSIDNMIYLCAMCNYVTCFICNTICRIVYLSMYTFHKTFQASLPAHTHLTATDSFKNWNQKNTRCFFPWQHGDSTNLTKTKKKHQTCRSHSKSTKLLRCCHRTHNLGSGDAESLTWWVYPE